jgi:hypothetical protein
LINSVNESSGSLSASSSSSSPISDVKRDQIIVIMPGQTELFASSYNLSSSTQKI